LRAKIIACETLGDEIRKLAPPDMICRFLEFGLHRTPDQLHAALQAEIDATPPEIDTILFGYGMCSRGTVGLEARRFRLVIPRVDDCIALFLGSKEEYARQHHKAPGTFYLTKGWIKCGDDPYTEYLKLKEKYGAERAYQLEKRFIENYTRLLLIHSGDGDYEEYHAYACMQAEFFDLALEEIAGSDTLLRKLIQGEWDEDVVIVEPGETVRYSLFFDNLD
jgi:Protein of unknown function (DUF1638)